MTRRIVYVCDVCQREYPYVIQATEKDRGILGKIAGYEVCRKCLKELINVVNEYVVSKAELRTMGAQW